MRKQNVIGMFLGLAIGDAMGSALEFMPIRERNDFVEDYQKSPNFPIEPGQWTDDTSMALAIADALIENDGNWNPTDTMDNFLDWYQSGKYSCIDRCFDIGNTCRDALHRYMMDSATPYQGDTDPQTSGNGALMRMAPVIMVASSLEEAMELAVNQTKLTHGSDLCIHYSKALAYDLFFGGKSSYEGTDFKMDRNQVMTTGFVQHSYDAAWWAVRNGKDFESAIIKAINLGGDADTIGAIAGQIAGAHYGAHNIPEWMLSGLYNRKELEKIAVHLYNIGRKKKLQKPTDIRKRFAVTHMN